MKDQAIALCRVSTPEQRLSNSLNRQEISVRRAAERLNVDIVRSWSGDASSKVGRNYKRKDLLEAFEFCKKNRRVKYLIVDEVDRFMRSTQEMFYWMTKFEQEAKVQVYFASNPEHNAADAKARLLLSLEGFKAEGSNEERQQKSVNGHAQAIREGRYTFNSKPGYQKGIEPGVHIPHPITFRPLQKALKDVSGGFSSPQEALAELNTSRFAEIHATWRMDKFRRYATDPYYAGILVMDHQVKAHNQTGRHEAMLSLEEHEQLLRIFNGSVKQRGPRKQYNPGFPMNKIMTCGDCGGEVKFTGSKKNNGYARKTTNYYYKYHCRGCGKSYHREEVHQAITERLQQIVYDGRQEADFQKAMIEVWKKKQGDKLQTIRSLEKQLDQLQSMKSKMVREMITAEPKYKEDIKAEIDNIKRQAESVEKQISEFSDLEDDLIDFLKFGLNYTKILANDWWQLDHDERVRCQQLIIPGGISFNSERKVGTPKISPVYSLKPNKKALDHMSKALMVELVGTAPTSAGLSWLIVYRLRSFRKSRGLAGK